MLGFTESGSEGLSPMQHPRNSGICQKAFYKERQKEIAEEREAKKNAALRYLEDKKQREAHERRKAMEAAEARKEELLQKAAERIEADAEAQLYGLRWRSYIRKPIPDEIQQEIDAICRAGVIEKLTSPLDYVGYRKSRMKFLCEGRRRLRLEVCFRIRFPKPIRERFPAWGAPASCARVESICSQLSIFVYKSGLDPNSARVKSEWIADRAWISAKISPLAKKIEQDMRR